MPYVGEDEVLGILDADAEMQEPGFSPYKTMDSNYKTMDSPNKYVGGIHADEGGGKPNGHASTPAPPRTWTPGTVGRAELFHVSVRAQVAFLNRGLGGVNVPDPRTVPLRGLFDPKYIGEDKPKTDDDKKYKRFVKYIDDPEVLRDKYLVQLGSTMMRRGQIFDTGRIRAFFRHRRREPVAANRLTPAEKAKPINRKEGGRAKLGQAEMGRDENETINRWGELMHEWGLGGLIWVCSMDAGQTKPSFYSHVGKEKRFHHSSFKAGGGVIGAGEWIVQKGKLLKISANSGHYQPTIDFLHRSVMYMAEAWTPKTVVLLWNIPKDSWEEVPVLMFRDNPTGNGMYRAHPKG